MIKVVPAARNPGIGCPYGLRALSLVTATASGVRILLAVTIYAAIHRRDLCCADDRHVSDISMTAFACLPSGKVNSMTPVDKPGKRINANPGNRFLAPCEFVEFDDLRAISCDRLVAGHTDVRIRNRHRLPGVGIAVTRGTVQALRGMQLVIEGNRLYGIFTGCLRCDCRVLGGRKR